jgi:hypothetical protein
MTTKQEVSPPAYVGYEIKEREEFLSERGNFTPSERAVFHRLCSMWEAEISYRRVTASLNTKSDIGKADLDRLVDKLFSLRIGVVRTKLSANNSREPHRIVLTEEGDRRYYATLLDELFTDLREDPHKPLPTVAALAERGIAVPPGIVILMDVERLSEVLDSREASRIFQVNLVENQSVLFSSATIGRTTEIIDNWVRTAIEQPNILSAVARLKNASLSETKKSLSDSSPEGRHELVELLLNQRPELERQRSFNPSQDFFVGLDFLRVLLAARLRHEKERQDEESERRADMEAISEAIRNEEGGLVSQERLDELFQGVADKHEGRLETFKFEFLQEYVRPKERRDLPRILYLNKTFIHRDHVFPIFRRRVEQLSERLRSYYVQEMVHQLKTNNRDRDMRFYSKGNFEADVRRRIPELDPLVSNFLSKPSVVAEAAVLWAKQQKAAKNVDDLKRLMYPYFEPGSMKFRDLCQLFQLNMLEVFDYAFPRLSLFRQIIMRITGRYRGYREQYLAESRKLFDPTAEAPEERGAKEQRVPRRGRKTGTARPGEAKRSSAAPSASGRKGEKSSQTEQSRRSRYYTDRDREKAWEEFKNNLRRD